MFDIVIIGSGAGGGTMAHALASTVRAHPDPRARRLRPSGGRELGAPPRSGRICATGRRNAGSTNTAASSSPTRTTTSAATPSSGAACSTGCAARTSRRCRTPTACRRPGRSTTRRWRRTTIGPSSCTRCAARSATIRPSRRARPYPFRRCRTRPAWRASRSGCARLGLHPSPLPLGLLNPGEPAGCRLCNTCNSFVCRIHAKSDADVIAVRPAHGTSRTSRSGRRPAHAG